MMHGPFPQAVHIECVEKRKGVKPPKFTSVLTAENISGMSETLSKEGLNHDQRKNLSELKHAAKKFVRKVCQTSDGDSTTSESDIESGGLPLKRRPSVEGDGSDEGDGRAAAIPPAGGGDAGGGGAEPRGHVHIPMATREEALSSCRRLLPHARGCHANVINQEYKGKRDLRWQVNYRERAKYPRSITSEFVLNSYDRNRINMLKCVRWAWMVHKEVTGAVCPHDIDGLRDI